MTSRSHVVLVLTRKCIKTVSILRLYILYIHSNDNNNLDY